MRTPSFNSIALNSVIRLTVDVTPSKTDLLTKKMTNAMKKPETKRVTLLVLDRSAKVRVSKILRAFTKKPYQDLIKTVANSQSIFLAELVPEQFYKGVNEIVVLLNKLDSNQIPYTLFINGELESKEPLLNIKNNIKNSRLEDFR